MYRMRLGFSQRGYISMKKSFKKVAPVALCALTVAAVAQAATITVTPTGTKQEIVGFGGGSVYYQSWIANLPAKDQEAMFDTAFTGLNLSLLRIGNWLQDESKDLTDDITIVKAAQKRLGNHLKIEMSSWSAPGSLKPSGSVNGQDGHSKSDKTLKKASGDAYGAYAYTDFASWWKRSLETYAAAGIVPDYISLQNEPDMEATYEETLFEPTETSEIAGYKEALNAVYDAVKGKVKILGPEPLGIGYENFEKYAKELDNSKLDGYAYHLYHAGDHNDNSGDNYLSPENFRTSMQKIADAYGTKPIIMTEFCSMLDEPREQDMLGLAHIMQIGFTDGKLGGYIAWELFWGYHGQMIGVCPGASWDLNGQNKYVCESAGFKIFPEYHAMRHYSKFVNPGWKVIDSKSDTQNLYTVAFRSANGDSITVVAINKASASDLTISIDGYSPLYAVQSVEGGDKSKEITAGTSISAPAKSITTVVFVSSTKKEESGNKDPSGKNSNDPASDQGPAAIYAPVASGLVNDQNTVARVFDLNGNLLWVGAKNQALNADGALRLDIRQGMYIMKTKASSVKVLKK